jgi:hypothetical protein
MTLADKEKSKSLKRAKRQAKVTALAVAEKMSNPLTPMAEIARRFNLNPETLKRRFEEAGYGLQALPTVQELVETNHLLKAAADNELMRRVMLEPENVRSADLIAARNSVFNQNQLLQGKPTELIGIKAIIESIQTDSSKKPAQEEGF